MRPMNETLLQVLRTEKEAIEKLIEFAPDRYNDALKLFSECKGKIVFLGVGKSGHVGKKIAATFSSTGTPAFFVHATESVHGDMGMIEPRDVVVLISNSGATKEVLQNLPGLKSIGCKTVAFTADADSELSRSCDAAVIYPKPLEADHLNLAPTSSSTVTLVLGDALACALSGHRNFSRADFYKYHPAGALGQMLGKEKE